MSNSRYKGVINFLDSVEPVKLFDTLDKSIYDVGYNASSSSHHTERTLVDPENRREPGRIEQFEGMLTIMDDSDVPVLRMYVGSSAENEDTAVPFTYNQYNDPQPDVLHQVMDRVCERLGITDEEYAILEQ